MAKWFLTLFLLSAVIVLDASNRTNWSNEGRYNWTYIVVGAGPAGLQMGYFLHKASRDYIILERGSMSGSFFQLYPRHDKLISINKLFTGKTNKEFNLRHDWNSLLSDDDSLLYRHFSKDFFPHRETMLHYLNEFEKKLELRVRHGVDVRHVGVGVDEETGATVQVLEDQSGQVYKCRILLLATGMESPNIPNVPWINLAEGYESFSTNPSQFEGKKILILGHGNAAFETADALYGHASVVHLVGRSRVRLAWETHYVGDVRAVNNGVLDSYQLKSLDGVVEGTFDDLLLNRDHRTGKITTSLNYTHTMDNFALRHSYDSVIRCLGFTFNCSIFTDENIPRPTGKASKYVELNADHQVATIPNVYILGTAAHSLDFRRSSGGFIHGLRYTTRMVHHLMEWKEHGVPWPSSSHQHITQLLSHITKRINEASGIYQMFSYLADVVALRDNDMYEYFEDFPLSLLPQFSERSGHHLDRHIAIVLQYGQNFSGPGADVFRESRATGHAHQAHRSNFLHPVMYFFNKQITEREMTSRPAGWLLPRPDRMHHVVEDFLTNWSSYAAHLLPLRRFLEKCTGRDMRVFTQSECFVLNMSSRELPITCREFYINGQGLVLSDELSRNVSQ